MSSEWPTVQIDQVCELIVDCVNKTAPVVDGPTPYRMIRTTNIRNGRIDLSGCRFVDEETFAKWTRRADLQYGDVLLTREAPIGEVGFVLEPKGLFLGQRVMQYRADPAVLSPRFLLYTFLSPALQHQFGSHEGSGSVVSHIRVGDCFKFKLTLPPLTVQKEIAALLGALDDRIALLRETNTTLEAIAQALFKSWFVDFDPVHAKQQGLAPAGMDEATAALFADTIEEWARRIERPTADALIKTRILLIGDGYRAKNNELGTPGVPFVRGGDLLQGRITPTKDFLAVAALNGAKGKTAKPGDTAFTSKGTIGRFAFVDAAAGEAVYSPQVCFWRSLNRDVLEPVYLHFWMKSPAFTRQVDAVCGQAAIMDFVSLSDQRKMTLDVPPVALQARFANAVEPLLERISCNRASDACLSEIRDTLLPRLISGQLRLPEAQEQLEEAIA